MKIGEKIRTLRKARGMTISELALLTESDVGNISRLERGKQGYSDKTIKKLADALQVPVSELFTSGKSASPVGLTDKEKLIGVDSVYRVDVLNVSSATYGGSKANEFNYAIKSISYNPDYASAMFGLIPQDEVKLISVKGDSMQGTIEPGDLVFVDQRIRHFDGDGIYVFTYDGDFYVKRLQKVKNNILVISDNPRYKEWSIGPDEQNSLNIAGRVLLTQSQQVKRLS